MAKTSLEALYEHMGWVNFTSTKTLKCSNAVMFLFSGSMQERACDVVSAEGHLHGTGGQVGVFMFELSIESQTPLLPVIAQCGGECVHLTERGARRHLVTADAQTKQSVFVP